MKGRLLLCALAVLCMADDCDNAKPGNGNVGYKCFDNDTCNDNNLCVVWNKQDHSKQSVCAAPDELVVGGFLHPKPCVECPPPVQCPKLNCPKVPEGPCPECKLCEPGWRRPK
jgi:hypothetical protein